MNLNTSGIVSHRKIFNVSNYIIGFSFFSLEFFVQFFKQKIGEIWYLSYKLLSMSNCIIHLNILYCRRFSI